MGVKQKKIIKKGMNRKKHTKNKKGVQNRKK